MNIKVTSLCIGDIYQKTTVRKEFRPGKFGTDVTSVPYKENALLIKVGSGYVDIDTIKNEKSLKEKYNEVNALGEFRNGCGILRDTIPFDDNEGLLYVDYESIKDTSYDTPAISFKKLKKVRENNGKNINHRRRQSN